MNISLPKTLIDEADSIASLRSSSRSEFIRDAMSAYVLREKLLQQVYKIGKSKAKKLGIKSEDDAYKFLER